MGWELALAIVVIVLGFGFMGTLLAMRTVLRRRVKRAERSLPPAQFSGPAVLIGTSLDESLTGVGALALYESEVVFVHGATCRSVTIPRIAASARGYRNDQRQRTPSLRFDWPAGAAVFDVQKPGLDDWLGRLTAATS